MFVLYLGFTFALSYILSSVNEEFDNALDSGLTLFRAILGDFDFSNFAQDEDANVYLVYFGYGVMLLYLIIGSLVLLNLLIALMATTYEKIDENATSAIIFARFNLALGVSSISLSCLDGKF